MPFCLTQKQVCGILQRMGIFTRKLKLFCAIFILGILSAWLIAFPLHFALKQISVTDRYENRQASCNSCCSHHFANDNDTDRPAIKTAGHDTGFCSLCELAAQFFTSGLARILNVSFSENISTLGRPLKSICSNELTLVTLPRGPPALIN